MDARHFDALARTVTEMGTRRGLLALLATLPLLGGLFALLDPEETDAKGRRQRRKKRHKHGQGKHKKNKKKPCKARSRAKICANRCGIVKNKQTCQKPVDCGPCACDPLCPICQTCNETTGVCQPDASQQGDDCGEPGQVCQADGTCACDGSSCSPCEECQPNGTCGLPCDGAGCCDDGACVSGEEHDACGRDGEACQPCSGTDTCGGGGQDGVCGCTPTSCADAGKDCGTLAIGCGETEDCGPCPFPNQPCDDNVCGTCVPDCTDKACGAENGCGHPCLDGTCPAPDTCGGGNPGTPGVCGCTPTTCEAEGKDCGTLDIGCGQTEDCGSCNGNGTTPICDENVCTGCSASHTCPSGCCAGDGSCLNGTDDGACGAIGGACANCGSGRRCVDRTCVCDATSCPNGCCDAQGQCQVDNNHACGAGGVICSVSCSTSQVCSGGTCIACSAACPGCPICFRETAGSWFCGTNPTGTDCGQVCATSSTCSPGYVCADGFTNVNDNSFVSFPADCTEPEATGICGYATACQA